jgi:hypothetical protein
MANDGAFFAAGNHLIPINETQVRVQKEILTLKKINNGLLEVTVYYEFFNPSEEKKILVGFEAGSPSGDVDGTPKNGHHPYMYNFTVEVNNSILKHQVAYVSDSLYTQNGKIKSMPTPTEKDIEDINYVGFNYVYYFEARFKKGLTIIKHTYSYDVSHSVDINYDFSYVLTAANRWANKQIDDFTLIIDVGDFESFYINKSFFKSASDWLINGIGKKQEIKGQSGSLLESDAVLFHIQKGNVMFHKKNFKIYGDLFLFAVNHYPNDQPGYIPFSRSQTDRIPEPTNDFERTVLKNLPFARRGYVFKNRDLSSIYETFDWYIPNPNYEADMHYLTEEEKKWVEQWK